MMKKMLMLASVASMIDQFNMNNISLLRELGVEVHVAANFVEGSSTTPTRVQAFQHELEAANIPYHQIDFTRNILNVHHHVKAYRELKQLMSREHYDFMHCHSPIGGVIGRLVAKKLDVPVIYTAHGFHFFEKSSILSWLIFYPIERFLSRYTDVLITINEEDYERAQDFHAKKLEYVPGVGIELMRHQKPLKKSQIRRELGLSDEDYIIVSVGELNENKNHQVIIKALDIVKQPSIHYVACGQGEKRDDLEELARQLGLQERVHLVGFREDIMDIYETADLFVFPSIREGLSVSLMEAMVSEVPVICSDIRGNRDLIDQDLGGFLFEPTDVEALSAYILEAYNNPDLMRRQAKYNLKKIQNFTLWRVNKAMRSIYGQFI